MPVPLCDSFNAAGNDPAVAFPEDAAAIEGVRVCLVNDLSKGLSRSRQSPGDASDVLYLASSPRQSDEFSLSLGDSLASISAIPMMWPERWASDPAA